MIIKAPPGKKNNTHNFRNLTTYIADAHKKSKGKEKTLFTETRNIYAETLDEIILEMEAVASQNIRVKNPIFHVILSWRQGEIPTREQVRECVSIYLKEVGMEECQVFYGIHKNTDNLHLHISINRIHPESYHSIQPADGWWKKANERAAREIELRHGWDIEQSGRYEVIDGEVVEKYLPKKGKALVSKAKDFENLYAEKSALRIAKEQATEIFQHGNSWEEIQKNLATVGMKMERKGSGLIVWVGAVPVKASNINQRFGFGKLKARLGEYDIEGLNLPRAIISAEPLRNTKTVREYMKVKNLYFSQKKRLYEAEKQKCRNEWSDLKRRQAADRKKLYLSLSSWKGRGKLLNAMRQVQAAEHKNEKKILKKNQKERRLNVLQNWNKRFPDYKTWLQNQGRNSEADVWRYRDSIPGVLTGDMTDFSQPVVVFTHHNLIAQKVEVHGRGCMGYLNNSGLMLTDDGYRINVMQWRDRDNALAAMQLAHQKWGDFLAHGSEAYIQLCIKIAAEEGFKLRNYQKEVREIRGEIEKERRKSEVLISECGARQFTAFILYDRAVAADRYRVTAIKDINGKRRAFVLGKEAGVITTGFSAAEIKTKLPLLMELDAKGNNLYFTPISDKINHVLVDDLSREKLQTLRSDGYSPALLLESSPGNYQAIFNVPKIGEEHNQEVSNKLMRILNEKYGDPKISGAVHPHRIPFTHNYKARHQRDNGTFPEVRVIEANGGVCDKASKVAALLQAKITEAKQQIRIKTSPMITPQGDMPGDTYLAYLTHVKNILSHIAKKTVNWNQVDSMSALRLYATGHDIGAIKDAIEKGAPQIRPEEMRYHHKWADYAARTAKYIQSIRGRHKAQQLMPNFLGFWYQLEGRRLNNKKERGFER